MKVSARVVTFLLCMAATGAATAGSNPPASASGMSPSKPAILSEKAAHSLLVDVTRAGNRLVAVGERGHILYSDDEGLTWKQAPTPTRTLLTAVFFSSDKSGWAVGHDSTILHTADGGNSWELQHQSIFDEAAVNSELDAQMAAEDKGAKESRRASRAQHIGAALMGAWFDTGGRHGITVGAYGLVLETDDGGATWKDRSDALPNSDGWHLNAVAAIPGASPSLLIVGEKGLAFRSADGGRTFTKISTPAESSLFGALGTRDGAYAFGLQGRLFRVSGDRWQPVASGVTFGLNHATELPDHSVVVVGNAGIVVKVSPAGKATLVRRADRQALLSAVAIKDGLVLVGEGGARRARLDGSAP